MTGFRFKSMSHRVSRAASLLAIMLAAVAPIATGIGSGPFVAPTDRVGTSAVAPPREIGTDAVWQVGGAEAGDYLGYSIATAGDVNGDGYGDVIIGAPRHSNPQVYEGAAFLYLGSAGGLSTAPAWSYESNQIGAGFGICVAPAGDVNNDGYADVIVGADTYDIGQSEEGCAFVFLGSSSGLAPTPIWTGQGDQAGAQYGLCVATAGDVNGDGYDDILVGAPFYDNSSSDDGRAYLYYGAAYGVESDFAWAIGSGQTSAQLGRSVATAGDVNADGYADIIIGADRYDAGLILDCGRAWVYLGSSTGIAGGYVWVQTGVVSGDHFGWCVAAAGDTDGDGYADVVVGAPEADGSLVDEGRIYVYRGTPTGVAIPPMRTLSGGQTNARYGTSVAPAGDTNGDSFADLVVGARLYDGGQTDEGKIYVYEGSVEGLFTAPVWTSEIDQADARYGSSVGAAGDVDGDGFGDVLAGTWAYDMPAENAGGAWAFAGGAEGLSDTPGWARLGDQVASQLGTSVCIAGDVNGDGFSDVAVGAPYYDNTENDEGTVWGYLGSGTGPSSQPNWIGLGENTNDWFGMEIAAAGDVNGDGYGDLLVGAPEADHGGNSYAGKVYLYLGSEVGLWSDFAWTQGGDADYMALGISIDGAGDVNGDGYADVIIGSHGHMVEGGMTGQAFLYLGSSSGLAGTPAWSIEGIPGSFYSEAVAGAGDVNGDGYSDVIIGSTDSEIPGGGIGQAFVYLGGPSGLPYAPAWAENLGQVGDEFGWSVDGAGDMNGDGYDEVIVGAPGYDPAGYPADAGAVAIYLGSAAGPATSPSWFTWSDQAESGMGIEVCGAGDLNGDGYSDVAFSAPGWDTGLMNAGCVHAKFGSAAGPTGFIDWTVFGTAAWEGLGSALDGAGDTNGDGFDDLIAGSPGYQQPEGTGLARIFFGNDRNLSYRGFPSIPRQQQRSDESPIDLLGRSESLDGFQLATVGHSAAGRMRVRMEWQAAEQGTPLHTLAIEHGAWRLPYPPMPDFGSYVALTAEVSGLDEDSPCHWRLRVASRSPFFPWTPWTSTAGTVPAQSQVRTARSTEEVPANEGAIPNALRVEPARPTPFDHQVSLVYVLPTGGPVRVTIYDVSGRCVRTLVDASMDPGCHVACWDGADGGGRRLPGGVYLARVESAGVVRTAMIVRRR